MYNILICDDQIDIVNALKIYLSGEPYQIYEAYTGKQALSVLAQHEIHLVLLDIMMPEMDGISAMMHIRQTSNVPIILLTAKSEDSDKILGLHAGADDYITKPFHPVEVLARIKSQLRRYMQLGGRVKAESTYVVGGIELDDKSKIVTVDGVEINFTPREYDILKLLLQHPNQVFSPKEIYKQVWQEELFGSDNIIAVHIRHLREKVEVNPADPRYLKVVWGQGYKMDKRER